jgi:hypothetical protein
MAVPVVERKSTGSTDTRPHDKTLTIAADGSLQVLELFGHVMLRDSHKPREVPRGRWPIEQHGADSLPYRGLPAVIDG